MLSARSVGAMAEGRAVHSDKILGTGCVDKQEDVEVCGRRAFKFLTLPLGLVDATYGVAQLRAIARRAETPQLAGTRARG